MIKCTDLKGKLFIVAAPSGAGKTSLTLAVINFLKKLIPIEKATTFTTRKPRTMEISGQDYNFIPVEKFLNLKKEGYFLETTEYNGNHYGSPASIISDLKTGKSLILVTDLAGAKNFKNNILPDAVTIWLTVSSLDTLRQRLESRNTEDKDTLDKRLKLAEKEIAQESAEHFFKYQVLNDDFETSVKTVAKIIQRELGI